MQSSNSSQQQNMITNGAGAGGRTAVNNFSMAKSASAASLKDSADGVLKDLETGLKQSTNYIQESHRRYEGPDGSQEWHEVRRGGEPDYNLEQQVQHMIGNDYQSQHNQNYAAANHLTTYKVQTNQYSGSGERMTGGGGEDEDRPASRLKQNIDDLDTLLYDLNNARHLSPDQGQTSEDYDDPAGAQGQGHVKRTVQAFNEFSQSGQQCEVVSNKPPSPSPRRQKAPGSPVSQARQVRPAAGGQSSVTSQQTQSQSYRYQTSSNTETERQEQPSYYTKFNSSKPAPSSSPLPTSVSFPNHQPRSPTPQMPPKRVEELMSEFHEFDNVHTGGSPTPPMFAAHKAPCQSLEINELPDGPPVRESSPPSYPRSVNKAGPEVYYPPGAEFTKSVQATHPVGDGGSLSLQGPGRREKRDRQDRAEGGDKQGAAVIPICLPLCCAAPCVIM